MAIVTAIDLVNAYAGGLEDEVFTSMDEVTPILVRITGREIFIFKTDDDLAMTVEIQSLDDDKMSRQGNIDIDIAAGAGNHAIWGPSPIDGFATELGYITVTPKSNGLMMVLRPTK